MSSISPTDEIADTSHAESPILISLRFLVLYLLQFYTVSMKFEIIIFYEQNKMIPLGCLHRLE